MAMTGLAHSGVEVLSLVMVPNIKHYIGLAGLLLVSFWCQGSLDATSYDFTEQSSQGASLLSTPPTTTQRGLVSTASTIRSPLRKDEFWLTESDAAVLPFDVEFVPPDDSWGQIEPMWSCDDNATRTKKLIFVNIVRTEVMEIQEILSRFASACHVGFVSTVMCSGLSWESMKDTWANRRTRGSKTGVKCPLKSASVDRRGNRLPNKYVQANLLKEAVDMMAGQVPIGSHEQWKNHGKTVDIQYVVSLRCPFSWFISSMIDKVKLQEDSEHVSTDIVVAAIKEKVEADLSANMYHEVYARYLITPSQVSWIQKEEADLQIAHRVELSLTNLKKHNALIVISEQQDESLEKLAHLIDQGGDQEELFARARRRIANAKGEDPLEGKILSRLKEDKEFFPRLEKYLKYEKEIYDRAKDMHSRQTVWFQQS